MMVRRERRSCSPMVAISTPSITILPPALSRIRNNAKAREDLPAPVRPTMPIYEIQGHQSLQTPRESEQCSCTGSTAYLLPSFKCAADVSQHQRKLIPVPEVKLLERYLPLLGPFQGGTVRWNDPIGLHTKEND